MTTPITAPMTTRVNPQSQAPKVKPRIRAGSWNTFMRRYQPRRVDGTEHEYFHHHSWLPTDIDYRLVWTALECGNCILIVPGFHMVNYHARLICRRPWSDVEADNPGYVW